MSAMKAGQRNKEPDMLLRYVQNFFQGYLVTQRGLSANTILAYRDTLKLCLESVSRESGKATTDLSLDDLTARSVLAFLRHIEDGRGNRANTRNQRLAALRTFLLPRCSGWVARVTVELGMAALRAAFHSGPDWRSGRVPALPCLPFRQLDSMTAGL